MQASLLNKLHGLLARWQELSELLFDPVVIQDQDRLRDISRERARLEPIVHCFQAYQLLLSAVASTETILNDPELHALAEEELIRDREHLQTLEHQLEKLLLPSDPNDTCNAYLELRAAVGGDESAIFCGDLFRMYARFAENKGWRVELLSAHPAEQGGFKELIALIEGQSVYSELKFESGAHRVQRVPKTEAQGRVHTSTCTVAVLPEIELINAVAINPADLKIDTFRASGAGGQHVQKTDSAIRITHIPTGLVVECQDERSQHKNRARALSLLQSKLTAMQQNQQKREQAEARRNLVGTGDRSERIRTYNFPQGRVTDHRINLTLYQLVDIMEGHLKPIIDPLIREHQADQLASLADDH